MNLRLQNYIHWSTACWLALLFLPSGLYSSWLGQLGIGGGALLVISILLTAISIQNGKSISLPWYQLLPIIVIAVVYISSGAAENQLQVTGRTREAAWILLSIPVYFTLSYSLVLSAVSPRVVFRYALFASLLGLLCTAFLGLLQSFTIVEEFQSAPGLGMMGHRNHYGYACSIGYLISYALSLIYIEERSRLRIVLLFIALFFVFCVAISLSRGAWVIAALLSIYFALMARSVLSFVMLLVIVVLSVIIYTTNPEISERFYSHDFSSGRFYLWDMLLPVTLDEWFFGQGAGFMWSLTQYDVSQWGGYISESNDSIYAHNDFLFLLVEVGLFLPLLWLLFLLTLVKVAITGIRSRGTISESRVSGLLIVGVCLFLLVSQSFDTVFFGTRNIFIAVALLAISSATIDSLSDAVTGRES
jgi:O-antigen ligase